MRFDLDEQQRDFAASIDAALAAADLPGAVRAWAAGDTGPGRKVWARLAELWKDNGDNAFGDQVADAWIKAQAYRLHTFGTVTRLAGGGELGAESSVTKVFWSDLDVAVHQTALEIRGADGELANAWTDGLLFALGGPIYAGTNEIQRNIIAERLLGLPREKFK